MNAQEHYLTEFTKHLRVAEPKRGEILAELKTHLDELDDGTDPVTQLGHPTKLANKYNQAHLGIFSSPFTILITPFIAWALIVYARIWAFRAEYLYNGNGPFMQLGQYLPMLIAVVTVIGLSALVIGSLAMQHRPWKLFSILLVLTTLIGASIFFWTDYTSHRGQLRSELFVNHGDPATSMFDGVLRDPATKQLIPENQLKNYTIPVNVPLYVAKAIGFTGLYAAVFGIFAYAFLRVLQRRFTTTGGL